MIEIFKTNLQCPDLAKIMVSELKSLLPGAKVSFDLEDCDRILRVESEKMSVGLVIEKLNEKGIYSEVLL